MENEFIPEQPVEPHPQEVEPYSQEIAKLSGSVAAGANWFYWIAGLSLVNSLILLARGNVSFVIGLGVTQILDGIAGAFAQEIGGRAAHVIKGIGLAADVVVALVFVLIGRFANKRCGWAFVLGMIIYALDGLLFLPFQDWLSIGFHVFALLCILSGYTSLRKLNALMEQ